MILIKPNDGFFYNIEMNSNLGKLLQNASLIILNEAPMILWNIFKALDHSLRDIKGVIPSITKNQVFGRKTIVFGANLC